MQRRPNAAALLPRAGSEAAPQTAWAVDSRVLDRTLAAAAREVGIGLVAGAIVRDSVTGVRHNRPEGSYLLGAIGAELILVLRATEARTWERWKLVLRANAVTNAALMLSVNRQDSALQVPLGGPAVAVDPHGDLIAETLEPVAVVALRRGVVRAAREAYPGYLPVRAALYASGRAQVRSPAEH